MVEMQAVRVLLVGGALFAVTYLKSALASPHLASAHSTLGAVTLLTAAVAAAHNAWTRPGEVSLEKGGVCIAP